MHNQIHGSLSSGQQGLWLLHQLDPNSDRYHMPLTFQFAEQVDKQTLEQVLTAFVQRHDMLRSVFVEQGGQPVRQVQQAQPIKIKTRDVSGLSAADLPQVVRQLSQQPFDLSSGPLLRASLLLGADCGDVLLLTIHHIAFDGASLKVMYEELGAIHQSISNGQTLSAPSLTYQDYVNWQQAWLASSEAQASQAFWTAQLSGDLPQLNLPADLQADKSQPIRGEYLKFTLPEAVVTQFKALAKTHGCSEYVVWLMAYFSFLSRYTGQADLIIGTPSMGRPEARFDDLVGYFVNLIPLRCQVNPETSFSQLLEHSKNDIYSAMMHADYPLAELIKVLGEQGQRGDQPLFQSSFVWTMAEHLQTDENNALALRILPLLHEAGEQDLSLELLITTTGISCLLKYRSNLYSQAFMQQLKSSWLTFVDSLCTEADSPIKDLSLVSEAEEDYLLHQLNDNTRHATAEQCIHHLLEQQARLNPDAIALEFEQQSISYHELNTQANRLANQLLAQQVHSSENPSIIGLCVPRSPAMVVGLLAILKAGAAYLPIDPQHPARRIQHMLQDSGVELVLTQTSLQTLTAGDQRQQWLLDDTAWLAQLPVATDNPAVADISPEALAYVIYTSGSTGQPKGVLQTHRTVVNLVHAQAAAMPTTEPGLNRPLRTLQFAPLSFDVSIQEISTCWFTGSPLVMISQAQKDQLHHLPDYLETLQIERLFLPPMVLNWLAETLQASQRELPALSELVVAGEVLTVSDDLRSYLLSQSQCRLWNHYGPTETHVATSAVVDVKQTGITPPIGHVLPNLTAWVLDAHQQLVPMGAVGELYIGGAGVAKGYLKQAALTAASFVPHPYDDQQRLYKTGDLVRYLPDGQLAFIGRLDEQVKIRGFRIELGEVEQQLCHQAGVKSAVVVAHQTADQAPQLVAYVCPQSSTDQAKEVLLAELKGELREQLPDYMIPAHFMLLDKLPLTANGKVDRNALPTPDLSTSQGHYVAPTGEVALTLVHIWSDLLGLAAEKISGQANFFELGGHSLLVARLINEVKNRLQLELSYQLVFAQNSLQNLANEISHQLKAQALVASLAAADSVEEMEW